MNHFLRLFQGIALFISMGSVHGTPPASLAGKVLHTREAQVSIRSAHERALRLNADGSYSYLFLAIGSALPSAPWKYFISPPPGGGTYVYARTDEDTASLTLTEEGFSTTFTLNFQDDVSGHLGVYPADVSTFYLTESDDAERIPLSNVSLRGRVSYGQSLIGGIIVPGSHARFYLIRVVGPSLAQFGVADLWTDPDFTIYDGGEATQLSEVHYSDWSINPYFPNDPSDTARGFTCLFKQLHLFEFLPSSKDAVALVWLTPGAHTIVCSAGLGDPGGEALLEVYSLP